MNDIALAFASLALVAFSRSIAFGSSTILNSGAAGFFAGFAAGLVAFAAGAGCAGGVCWAALTAAKSTPTTISSARPMDLLHIMTISCST